MPVIQHQEIRFVDLVDDRWLECFYKMLGGIASEEAAVVGDKIPGEKERGDVLLPFLHILKSENSLPDKGDIIAYLPLTEDKFLFGNRLLAAAGDKISPFAVTEHKKSVEIIPDLIHLKTRLIPPVLKIQKAPETIGTGNAKSPWAHELLSVYPWQCDTCKWRQWADVVVMEKVIGSVFGPDFAFRWYFFVVRRQLKPLKGGYLPVFCLYFLN